MILRRITEHVKAQNWFAVGLDFLIVVVGVFIGLQVNTWNGARQEHLREASYLRRLHDEVATAQASTVGLGENVADRVADAERVADIVYGRDMSVAVLDAQACDSIARLHIFYLEGYALPTLEELIASGQFGLIRDEGLRKSLSDYLSFARGITSRAEAVSARAPNLPQQFPAAITLRSWITDGVRVRENVCDLDAMRADPAFLNAFTEVRQRAGFFQSNLLAQEIALVAHIHLELDRVLTVDHETETDQ